MGAAYSSNVGGSATFTDGGCFSTAGTFVIKWTMGACKWDITPINAAGVDGQGTKNYGYREQDITVFVRYVDTTKEAVMVTAQTDNAVMGSGTGTLVIDGLTFVGCVLKNFDTDEKGVKGTGLGTVYIDAKFTVTALRIA